MLERKKKMDAVNNNEKINNNNLKFNNSNLIEK